MSHDRGSAANRASGGEAITNANANIIKRDESIKILKETNQIDSSDNSDGEYEEVLDDEYDEDEEEVIIPPNQQQQ